jgi:predicted AlkP superfamily pyrophosphatase or phosphodiesterase
MTHNRTIPAFLLGAATLLAAPASAAPVLLISIDALSPDYVTKADELGLAVPTLRRFMAEGAYAEGVRGVVPTITCPSHATLVTGVTPSVHGVYGNAPMKSDGYASALCTFASDIKVDALYDAAARAGIESGSVGWLNTAGSPSVTYNIPHVEPYESEITVKFQEAMSTPPGLLEDLEAELGSYYQDGTEAGSEIRLAFATAIMRRYKPGFMMFHIIAVDHAAHAHGPWSEEAKAAVEHEDAMIGRLIEVALANDPDTIIAVTSDHGQAPVTQALNLNIPLIEEGLITLEPLTPGQPARIASAKVSVRSGASGTLWLADPADAATRAQVSDVLHRLAEDPANGIDRVVEGEDVAALGGYAGADFVIGMKPGTVIGGDLIGDALVSYPSVRGTHGYLPEQASMNASFFIMGKGIAAGQDLGVVDMVQIAPTLAQALGVQLKDADQPALPVFVAAEN